MSPAHDEMAGWFLGDEEAIEFASLVWDMVQKWDDVIDDGSMRYANEVFAFIGFRVNYLPFFRRYDYLLRPVMLNAYLKWRDANVLERGDAADLEKAFMLRAGIYDVFAIMAWVIGGETHSQAVGPAIRRFYAERLADFIEERKNA